MVVGPAATARAQTQAVVKAFIMISRKALPTTTKVLELAAWFGILTNAFVPVVHTHAKAPAGPKPPRQLQTIPLM